MCTAVAIKRDCVLLLPFSEHRVLSTHSGTEGDLSALKKVTGVVDKEDAIPATMTVEEILTFNALTRLADKEKQAEAVSWALHVRAGRTSGNCV